MPEEASPIHVLHLLGSLKMGGVESWLLGVLRNSDTRQYRHSFVVSERTDLEFERRFLELGAEIHVCDVRKGRVAYLHDLFRLLKSLNDVDVMHSHVHTFSALNLLVAAAAGVKVRIAHSHTDRGLLEASAPFWRRSYIALAKATLPFVMTHGIGVSQASAKDLFGNQRAFPNSVKVIPCGVDLARFGAKVEGNVLRRAHGLNETDKVVFHTGNFVTPKNHEFLIRVGIELCKRQADVKFAFAGTGPLQEPMQHIAAASGFGDRFLFLGARSDVPCLLLGLADVFLFPSLWEGLPVALIEAQAAKLPCVVSDRISPEAFAPGADITVCNLNEDLDIWVSRILSALERGRSSADMSRFDLVSTAARLNAMYQAAREPRFTKVEVA